MNTRNAAEAAQPAAVLLTLRDGSRTEVMFANRADAELWLALVPLRQAQGDPAVLGIQAALLRVSGLGVN